MTTWYEKAAFKILEIFEVIGQIFKGHGMCTKIEWGVELSTKIDTVEKEMYKKDLKDLLSGKQEIESVGEIDIAQASTKKRDNLIIKLNSLKDADFIKLINDVFFEQYESSICGKKNKFVIYDKLDESKKPLFNQELVKQSHWYRQAYDIVEGSTYFVRKNEERIKNLQLIISPQFLEKAKAYFMVFIYQNFTDTDEKKQFFNLVYASIVKEFLKGEQYVELGKLLTTGIFNWKADTILKDSTILSEEEFKKISANINYFEHSPMEI